MPELKDKVISNFQAIRIKVEDIPYRDKHRERLRQEKIKTDSQKEWTRKRPVRAVPWSKQKEKVDKRKERKEKKLRAQKRKIQEADNIHTAEELEDLGSDLRLMKKLKKGKISKQDFDKEFGGLETGDIASDK